MNNFNSKLSQLYKQISHELSNEFDIVLSPKNPYITENLLAKKYFDIESIISVKYEIYGNILKG